jgi:mono/diheme cytochrome c family protein
MSEQHQIQNSNSLNANVAAIILVANFLVIGSLILAMKQPSTLQTNREARNEVALVVSAATLQPSTNTLLPPTFTLTPTLSPTITPTLTSTLVTAVSTATANPSTIPAESVTEEAGQTAAFDPALAARGEQLFVQCAACHGVDARGIPNLGKDLVHSEFVASLSDAELLDFVKTGRSIWDPQNTTGIDMPGKGGNPALTDDDIMAIIAYIHSLTSSNNAVGSSEIPAPVVATISPIIPAESVTEETGQTAAFDPALAARGEQLFVQCAACHGVDARGIPNLGKDLVHSEFVASLSDAELLDFVKTGRPIWDPQNTTGIDMPGKGGNPALTDDDITAIIAYIHSLSANDE